MTPRELGHALRTFLTDHDQESVDDTGVQTLEAQLETAQQKHTAAQQAREAYLLADGLAAGHKVDPTALRRLRAAVEETEDTVALVRNRLEVARRGHAAFRAARAERDIATLTPIFRELVSLYDERAEALVEVQDLLELAHTTAANVLPGTSSLLQAGYGGPLTREALEFWRARVTTAGLLTTVDRERVANPIPK